jgi:hypothetical protein
VRGCVPGTGTSDKREACTKEAPGPSQVLETTPATVSHQTTACKYSYQTATASTACCCQQTCSHLPADTAIKNANRTMEPPQSRERAWKSIGHPQPMHANCPHSTIHHQHHQPAEVLRGACESQGHKPPIEDKPSSSRACRGA